MRLLNNITKKWTIAALIIVCIISVNQAQNSKADTLTKVKCISEQCTNPQPAKAGSEEKIKKAPVRKTKSNKKSADISQCFANGFLYKRNTLSDI